MSYQQLRWHLALLLILALVIAACQPAATPTPTPRPTEPPPTETPVVEEEAEEEAEAEPTEAVEEEAEPTEAEPTEAVEEEIEATEAVEEVALEPTVAVEEEEAEAEPTEAVEEEAEEEAEAEPTEAVEEEAEEEALATGTPVAMAEVTGPTVVIAPDDDVIIGLATALSGEGLAPLGVDIQRGVEIARNHRPTVTVDGQEFTVVIDSQDDLCSAEGGQAVANRFAANPEIAAVIGPMCTSGCRAAAPIFDAADFTTVTASCSQAALATSGFSSFNRVVVSDAVQGVVAAEYIYNVLGVREMATIHDGSPYAEGLVAVVAERFTELGGTVVASQAVNVGDTDFRSLLEDIAQREPELIYFGGFAAEGARLAQQRADAGLEDTIFMGADGILGTEFIQLAGSASEGAYASSSVAATSDALTAFLDEYVETYGEQPPAPYHAHGYDAYNILLNAIEAVGSIDADGNLVIPRVALREYVRSFQDYQGLTGLLNADGTGNTSFLDIAIFQVEDGAFRQLIIGRIVDDEVIFEEVTATPAEEDTAAEETATEEAEE